MKKKTGKLRKYILSALTVILLFSLGKVEAQASIDQENNLVVIYGTDMEGSTVAVNGLLIANSKGSPVVVTAMTSAWENIDTCYIEGPTIEAQEVTLKANDSETGIAVFQTNLNEGGCESSDIANYDNLVPYQIAWAEGIDLSKEGDNWANLVSREATMVGSEYQVINNRRFIKLINQVSGKLIGGPIVLDDGRVAGIQLKVDDGYYWFITMDEVMDIVNKNSDGDIKLLSLNGSLFFLCLIPVFAIIFIISSILYLSSEKKRKAAGKEEFANVLFLGGESGLQLRGIGGYFDDVKFPLEEKIIFGRDASQCFAVYPKEVQGISRLHCSVEIKDGKVLLIDLGSTYGTFLEDGTKLEPNTSYYLNYGQSFYMVNPANSFRVV